MLTRVLCGETAVFLIQQRTQIPSMEGKWSISRFDRVQIVTPHSPATNNPVADVGPWVACPNCEGAEDNGVRIERDERMDDYAKAVDELRAAKAEVGKLLDLRVEDARKRDALTRERDELKGQVQHLAADLKARDERPVGKVRMRRRVRARTSFSAALPQ